MTAPFVIPTTSAAAQLVTANLGGQNTLLNIYTKSINVPAQSGPQFTSNRMVGIAYGAALNGNTMVVSGAVVGLLSKGDIITGDGLSVGSSITDLAPGTAGLLGTYYIEPSAPVTASTRVTAYSTVQGPSSQTLVDPPPYVNTNPVFIDVYLNDTLLIGGVLLRNRNRVIRNSYFGFSGDLAVVDTQGNSDPYGVVPRLPPPDLRNWWQRNLPLSLGGKAPPNIAGTLPGFGSRFLLVWWPSLT